MSDPAITAARAQVAALTRHNSDPDRLLVARRSLASAKLSAYIQRTVDSAPPLTTEQRDRLALLLRGGDGHGDAA